MMQLTELQKQPYETEVALRTQASYSTPKKLIEFSYFYNTIMFTLKK